MARNGHQYDLIVMQCHQHGTQQVQANQIQIDEFGLAVNFALPCGCRLRCKYDRKQGGRMVFIYTKVGDNNGVEGKAQQEGEGQAGKEADQATSETTATETHDNSTA